MAPGTSRPEDQLQDGEHGDGLLTGPARNTVRDVGHGTVTSARETRRSVGHGLGRSLTPALRRRTTSAMRSARTSGRRLVASIHRR